MELYTYSFRLPSSCSSTTLVRLYDMLLPPAVALTRFMSLQCSQFCCVVLKNRTRKANNNNQLDNFPLMELNDDLIIHILSFVSYAPFEMSVVILNNNRSEKKDKQSSLFLKQELKYLTKDYNTKTRDLQLSLCKNSRRKTSLAPDLGLIHNNYSNVNNRIASSTTTSVVGSSPSSFRRISDYRNFGTLTHVFPLINKRFYALCKNTSPCSSVLWTEALERIIRIDSSGVWKKGLISVMESFGRKVGIPEPKIDTASFDYLDKRRVQEFILNFSRIDNCAAAAAGGASNAKNCTNYHHQELFRQVYLEKPIQLPIFLMRHNIKLGEPISLYLFEPRYRIMMNELMASRSFGECSGLPIINVPRPRFLFSCLGNPEERGGCLVEVHNCTMHENGTANVTLIPVAWTMIENITARQEASGLLEGIISPPTKGGLEVV